MKALIILVLLYTFVDTLADSTTSVQDPICVIEYPTFCNHNDPHNLACNFAGTGTRCPDGCYLDNNLNCVSPSKNTTCGFTHEILCPKGCRYYKFREECISLNYTLCEPNFHYALCPLGCSYDYNLMKCVDTENPCYYDNNVGDYICPNSDVVCQKTIRPKCPIGCRITHKGCEPLPGMETQVVCERTTDPVCPSGCKYDFYSKVCKRNELESIEINKRRNPNYPRNYEPRYATNEHTSFFCEPMIELICVDKNYGFDLSDYPDCYVDYNYDSPCVSNSISDTTIYFPLRLKDRFNNITCYPLDEKKIEINIY